MPSSNKEKRYLQLYMYRMALKKKCIDYLGGKCSKCPENDFFKLCFHHIDPVQKELRMARNFNRKWNILERELNKCELLCHNCHKEYHFNQEILNTNKTTLDARKTKYLFLMYKNSFKCRICHYDKCEASLEFHHRTESDKKYSINNLSSKHYSNIENFNDETKKELDKCDILCSNCHSKHHSKYKKYEIYKKEIEEKSKTNICVIKKFSDNDIIELYKTKTVAEISRILNCTKTAISDRLKKLHKKEIVTYIQTPMSSIVKCTDEELISFLDNGGNVSKFAKEHKMGIASVWDRVNRLKKDNLLQYENTYNKKKFSDEELIAQIKNGLSNSELSKLFNSKNIDGRVKKLFLKGILIKVSPGKFQVKNC